MHNSSRKIDRALVVEYLVLLRSCSVVEHTNLYTELTQNPKRKCGLRMPTKISQ